jgi:hypothetical protein
MLLIFCGADFLLTGDGKALRALILVIHEFIIIFCGAGFSYQLYGNSLEFFRGRTTHKKVSQPMVDNNLVLQQNNVIAHMWST